MSDPEVLIHDGPFLLTGVTGFLGSEVFCRLVRSVGYDRVYCMVRKAPAEGSIFHKRLAEHGIEADFNKIRFLITDFTTTESLATALELAKSQLDKFAVVHMAAIIHAKGAEEKLAQQRLNIEVTDELLDWSQKFASHFVYISSVVSFGATLCAAKPRGESSFETFPFVSRFFSYYTSKRESHQRVIARAKVPVVLLCPGIIHGSLEMEKSSRKHLQYLREGKLKVAPSGSGNFVGLDRVAQSVVQSAMLRSKEPVQTRLLVDENLSFATYFTRYVRLARGQSEKPIRAVPRLVGWVALGLHAVLSSVGIGFSILESLAQGTLHLSFESEHRQPPTEGLDVNLVRSLGQ
jgi:nucleoside-diphosphate-sugar epimerase